MQLNSMIAESSEVEECQVEGLKAEPSGDAFAEEVKIQDQLKTASEGNDGTLDIDDVSCTEESVLKEINTTTEEGSTWAEQEQSSKGWFSWLFGSKSASSAATETTLPLSQSSPRSNVTATTTQETMNHVSTSNLSSTTESASQVSTLHDNNEAVPIWQACVFSTGVVMGLSAVGVALIMEADVYSPAIAAIRGHPWMMDFEQRCYRPMRSALINIVRRS